MRFSLRSALLAITLIACMLVAWKSTQEIWVFGFEVLGTWIDKHNANISFILGFLTIGFSGGWLARSRNAFGNKFISLVAFSFINIVMYSLTSMAIRCVDWAQNEQDIDVTFAMSALLWSYKSGTLLVVELCCLAALIFATFLRNGRYQEFCGFLTLVYWGVIIAMGFVNASACTYHF